MTLNPFQCRANVNVNVTAENLVVCSKQTKCLKCVWCQIVHLDLHYLDIWGQTCNDERLYLTKSIEFVFLFAYTFVFVFVFVFFFVFWYDARAGGRQSMRNDATRFTASSFLSITNCLDLQVHSHKFRFSIALSHFIAKHSVSECFSQDAFLLTFYF